MKLITHFLISLLIIICLFKTYGFSSLIILVTGVLIDLDHYIWYYFKFKRTNIFDSFDYFNNNIKKRDFKTILSGLYIFHTIEFLLILFVLSFFSEIVFLATVGLAAHLLMDIIHEARRKIAKIPSVFLWLAKK